MRPVEFDMDRVPSDPAAKAREPLAGGEIDVAALLAAIKQYRWWVIVPTIAVLVVTTLAVNIVRPRYTAETRVFLENRDSFYTRPDRDLVSRSDQTFDQEAVLSQVQIATSRDIARSVAKRNNLAALPEFDPWISGVGPLDKALILLGVVRGPETSTPEDRVFESYFDKLKVFPLARSRVLSFEFESKDPVLAARLSNEIAQEYLRALEEAKKNTASRAGGWLRTTIEPLRQRVIEAEAKAEAYRAQNGLLIGTNNTSITSQQLAEQNTQLSVARAQQSELQAQARMIRESVRGGRAFEVSQVVRDDTVRALMQTRANLRAQIAQESRTLLPQHPRMRELEAQVAGLEEQIRAAGERAARALENDARTAGVRVANVLQELDRQKQTTALANEAEVQQRSLEREAKALREQLDGLLVRQRDAEARDQVDSLPADARIVSRASEPSVPSFPKKIPIVVLATLATLVMSLAWIGTRALMTGEALRPRIAPASAQDNNGDDAGEGRPIGYEDVAFAGPASMRADHSFVPAERSRAASGLSAPDFAPQEITPEKLAVERPDPVELLRARLARRSDGQSSTLFVLQPVHTPSAGQTSLAVARDLSWATRTILVELGGPEASQPPMAAANRSPGIGELLTGEAGFSETIHRDAVSSLHLLARGRTDVAIASHVERLDLSLDALSHNYGLLILLADSLDTPFDSWATSADVVVILEANDGAERVDALKLRLAELGVIDPITVSISVAHPALPDNDSARLEAVA